MSFVRFVGTFQKISLLQLLPGSALSDEHFVITLPVRVVSSDSEPILFPRTACAGTYAEALSVAFKLMHPRCSFTLSLPASFRPQDTPYRFFHVVKRRPGDFVPNNMIYHRLREFEGMLLGEGLHVIATGGDCSTLQPVKLVDLSSENIAPTVLREEAVVKAEEMNLGLKLSGPEKDKDTTSSYFFWPWKNSVGSVAWLTECFMVLVNLKPVVEGHLLIVPRRIVGCGAELSVAETLELGRLVGLCKTVLWRAYCGNEDIPSNDFSVAVQQGKESGQTVPHLHVHVILFRPSSKLAGEPEEGDEEEQRKVPPRTLAEMAAEADMLRPLFQEYTEVYQ